MDEYSIELRIDGRRRKVVGVGTCIEIREGSLGVIKSSRSHVYKQLTDNDHFRVQHRHTQSDTHTQRDTRRHTGTYQ